MPPDPLAAAADARVQETQFTAAGDTAGETAEDTTEEVADTNERYPQEQHNRSNIISNYGAAQTSHHSTYGITPKPSPKVEASGRALAPDLLRGLLMVLQAIDHCAVSLGAWRHGVALESEADGTVVNTWNHNSAWTARMLTHLCAPGFMFLLGMGIVYFGRSRSKLGWTSSQMASHFAIRAFVLALINQVAITLAIGGGRFLIINPVLLALAINYLFSGLLWLAINASEKHLSRLLVSFSFVVPDDSAAQPLLGTSLQEHPYPSSQLSSRATTISWHLHNFVLFTLAAVTIWWNHWLSPYHGQCPGSESPVRNIAISSVTSWGTGFDFWFYPVFTNLVISPFPPLAWLSFAILGLLYARVVLARTWQSYAINASNALVSIILMLLFVTTRLFNFGNLSENCLRMPEQLASPGGNQYLASFRSFLYIVKYPPSFAFLAFTMSLNFLLLVLFGTLPASFARRLPTLMTFGTSALFFYILHMFLYGALGALAKMWFGHDVGYKDPLTGKPVVGTGDTPVFWITWLLGLAILYPLCHWYGQFKRTKGPNSIWRFF